MTTRYILQGTIVRATNVSNSGTNMGAKPYLAHRADGTNLGMFASVREAQVIIENAAVGGRFLVWTQEDRNGIEAYRGESIA